MFSSERSKTIVLCPVCGFTLGSWFADVEFKAHCMECRATFFFKPDTDKPSVIMDSAKTFKGYCGPEGCVCKSQH